MHLIRPVHLHFPAALASVALPGCMETKSEPTPVPRPWLNRSRSPPTSTSARMGPKWTSGRTVSTLNDVLTLPASL